MMKGSDEITFVTAFFDINRNSWEGFERGSNLYFDYFTHWASIKNDLIIYVGDEETKEKINSVRNASDNSTIVEVVSNVFDEDPLLDSSLKSVNYTTANHYRLLRNNPEAKNPDYNYIMMMKYHFLKKAIIDNDVVGPVAWIDFGFDHGGVDYSSSYFDFCAKYTNEKITMFSLFALEDLDNLSIVDLVLRMDTVIQGSLIVGPPEKMLSLCDNAIDAQKELNACGLMDDDQITLLMAYRKNPQNYSIINCDWHKGLFYIKEGTVILNQKRGIIKAFARSLKWIFKKIKYCFSLFFYLLSKGTPK